MNEETRIQQEVMVEVSKAGAIPYRMMVGTFYNKNGNLVKIGLEGTPDVMVILPEGKVAWFELKTPTGRLRESQKRFIGVLNEMGHETYVVRSKEQAASIMEELYERSNWKR